MQIYNGLQNKQWSWMHHFVHENLLGTITGKLLCSQSI